MADAECELVSDRRESLVSRPQAGTCGEQCCGEQVGVDVSDAQSVQLLLVDQGEDLVVCRCVGLGELTEQREDLAATGQVAECELTGDPGVREHAAVLKQCRELGVAGAQVIDPD